MHAFVYTYVFIKPHTHMQLQTHIRTHAHACTIYIHTPCIHTRTHSGFCEKRLIHADAIPHSYGCPYSCMRKHSNFFKKWDLCVQTLKMDIFTQTHKISYVNVSVKTLLLKMFVSSHTVVQNKRAHIRTQNMWHVSFKTMPSKMSRQLSGHFWGHCLEWDMSHMNETCHIWMNQDTCGRVVWYTNESYNIWWSRISYEWVMPRTALICSDETCPAWNRYVTYEWDMSRVNETCPVWMRHVTYGWDMSRMD